MKKLKLGIITCFLLGIIACNKDDTTSLIEDNDNGSVEFPDSDNQSIMVTGTLQEDSEFTVTAKSGIDFGTAPTIYAYSDFRDQTLGTNWDKKLAVGETREISPLGPIYPGRGKNSYALDMSTSKIMLRLPDVTEFFVSRAMLIREGGTWPGLTGWPNGKPEPGIFPEDSALKLSWLFSSDQKSITNDMIIPTYVNKSLLLSGNSNQFDLSVSRESFDFNGWTVMEGWVRADESDTGENRLGDGYIGIYSAKANSVAHGRGAVFSNRSKNSEGFYYNDATRSWKAVNEPGWVDTNGKEAISFTDVYMASGPQRIVLADHFDILLANHYVIQPHTSWNGTSIKGRLHLADLDTDAPIYLHVFDKDNKLIGEPVSLANPIIMPQGEESTFGNDAPIKSAFTRDAFFVNAEAYHAGANENIRDMHFWAYSRDGKVGFAIYESESSDVTTATQVYAFSRPVDFDVERPDIPAKGANRVTAHPLLKLTEGKYYWLGAQIGGSSYVILSEGDGEKAYKSKEMVKNLNELDSQRASGKIGLSATIIKQ